MGSGSYSFAVYASLASDRGYATKSADAVFTNHSLSANRIKSVPKNHLDRMTEELTNHVYVIRPYITRHGNGPIPTSKPVRKVEDPNNKFNEFQRTLRAVEFDVELLQHSLLVDSTFYPRHYSHRKVLVITHKDEITSQFNDELLSGDWEEQFNSIQMSYYDKLIV